MSICFTTTALNRPNILDRTYESFDKRLKGIRLTNVTLYLNIDPTPNSKNIMKCVEVGKKYFNKVIYNIPQKASFPAAIKWLWNQVNDQYVFHLEDDWELIRHFNIDQATDALAKNNDIIQVVLRAYSYKYKKLCLSPSIWQSRFCNCIAEKMNLKSNPELQLRSNSVLGVKPSVKNVIVIPDKKVIVKDIGRAWCNNLGIKKPTKKVNFTKHK